MERRWGCNDCSHCGFCCRVWDIDLSKGDIRKLVRLGYPLDYFLDTDPAPKTKLVGKEKNCVFLDGNVMCTLETKHGHEAKPLTCRKYPEKKVKGGKGDKDYFFYDYAGKTFTRDVFLGMLEKLKGKRQDELFDSLLGQLESLRRQKDRYLDVFNFEEKKVKPGMRKIFMERGIRKWVREKFSEEDRKEMERISRKKKPDTDAMIDAIKSRIPGNDAVNYNFPLMMLRFFCILRDSEPRDGKKLADYFFDFNGKLF